MPRRLLALVALVALPACLHAPAEPRPVPPGFLVVGHRGAPRTHAENTLPSLAEAVRLGASAVEVDVCLTADGRAVLWHDADPDGAVALARQAGAERLSHRPLAPAPGDPARRPVHELSLEELRATHGYVREGAPERDAEADIPAADELAAWAAGAQGLRAIFFDLKPADPGLAQGILDELFLAFGADPNRQILLLSTREDVRERARSWLAASGASYRLVGDFEGGGALETALRTGLRSVSIGNVPARNNHAFLADVEEAVAARDDGDLDAVFVWTVDARVELDMMLGYGVDGIMTNDPAELAAQVASPGPIAWRPEDYPWYAPWHRRGG